MNFKLPDFKSSLQGLGLQLTQARPEILLASGLISMAVATVIACTKTEECKKAVQECKDEVAKIDATLPKPEEPSALEGATGAAVIKPSNNFIKQYKIEKGRLYCGAYGRFLYKMVKIYGVAALLWFGGSGMVIGGHIDLRHTERALASQILAGTKAFADYRGRVKDAIGEENEQKIFMGAQTGDIVVKEIDEKTGEEKYVSKKADEFISQPGSIFAINFVEENVDFKWRAFPEDVLDDRIKMINQDFEWGLTRGYSGIEILRKLGITEEGLGNDDEKLKMWRMNGISGNPHKVPDKEMRKLKVTRLKGYQKRFDPQKNMDVWVPCLRLDFNFYPLDGLI